MGKAAQRNSAKTRTRNHLQNSQQFKGIRMRKWGKWVSEVRMPNSRERIWLGSYDTPRQAAKAYDAAVYCLRGHTAKLNFPDCPPEIPSASSLSAGEIQSAAARFALEGLPSPSANGGAEPLWPPSSSSSTGSEIEWEFWESLLADSQIHNCSNRLGMLMFDSALPSSSLEDGAFTFDQTDLSTL